MRGVPTLVDAGVRNVIFDLGGVLLEWNPDKILQRFYSDAPLRTLLKDELFLHPEWRAFNRGALSEAQLLERVSRRTGRPPAEGIQGWPPNGSFLTSGRRYWPKLVNDGHTGRFKPCRSRHQRKMRW